MIHIKSDVGRQAAIAAKTHVAGQGLRSEVGSIGITDNAARMSGQRRRRWPGILPPLSHIWLAQGDSGPAGVWQSSPLNPNQFCTCVSIRNPNSSGASPHWNHMSVCCLLDPVAVGICYIRPIRLPLYLYPPPRTTCTGLLHAMPSARLQNHIPSWMWCNARNKPEPLPAISSTVKQCAPVAI